MLSNNSIRNIFNEDSRKCDEIENNLINDPNYLYNGGHEDYEDPADYIARPSIRAVRLG